MLLRVREEGRRFKKDGRLRRRRTIALLIQKEEGVIDEGLYLLAAPRVMLELLGQIASSFLGWAHPKNNHHNPMAFPFSSQLL
jgi:hypothetical protein